MFRSIVLLLLCNCYGVVYPPLPFEEIDRAGGVVLYSSQPVQFSAADIDLLLKQRVQEFVDIGLLRASDKECVSNVSVYIASSFEDMHQWCDVDADPAHYVGCMYAHHHDMNYEGTGWVMVIRPDHAVFYPLLKFVVDHEVTHMALYCANGDTDPNHRSTLYP